MRQSALTYNAVSKGELTQGLTADTLYGVSELRDDAGVAIAVAA